MTNRTPSVAHIDTIQTNTPVTAILKKHEARIALYGGLAILTAGVAFGGASAPPPETVRLSGVVRDMTSTHSDFGDSATRGHIARLAAHRLGVDGLPVFTGMGLEVRSQWYDVDGHPIAPYGDAGLVGGHFDVDVFDTASTSELYHEHQYDDKFDVTYIDVANDTRLLFRDIITAGYANPLRLEFVNTQNGGAGVFDFEAGDTVVRGQTSSGFTTTFNPDELVALKVEFYSLIALRGTNPGTSQDDMAGRDGSFSIKMWDTVTDELVYEIVAYHHIKKDVIIETNFGIPGMQGIDACGDPINDIGGAFGGASTGGVTDMSSFEQWFRDVPGVNGAMRRDVYLTRDAEGIYEYLDNEFFPIDGELYGNEGELHNQLFTYSIQARFQYNACGDQFFEFEGNDSAWVFIDDTMVIDLGGTGTGTGQYIALDRLNLVDGDSYTLRLFYAQRRPSVESIFRIRTNLQFENRQTALPGGVAYD